jgi:hypothetical protein
MDARLQRLRRRVQRGERLSGAGSALVACRGRRETRALADALAGRLPDGPARAAGREHGGLRATWTDDGPSGTEDVLAQVVPSLAGDG